MRYRLSRKRRSCDLQRKFVDFNDESRNWRGIASKELVDIIVNSLIGTTMIFHSRHTDDGQRL
jgi:hypothetical protein